MSTILFPSPIFGPVHSRRLGVSLGVNLLPADGKLCSFDCIYCECGLNGQHRPELRMPTREAVREALRAKLESMKAEGVLPDTITFSGNGEPTSHPDFEGIIDDTLALRDEYAPKSQVSVLTNATHIVRNGVFRALLRVDNALLKLDTVDEDYIHLVDRPTSRYDLPKLIERMKAFEGRCIIQTMFMKGEWEGRSVDNTGDEYVGPWLDALREIGPTRDDLHARQGDAWQEPPQGAPRASRRDRRTRERARHPDHRERLSPQSANKKTPPDQKSAEFFFIARGAVAEDGPQKLHQ